MTTAPTKLSPLELRRRIVAASKARRPARGIARPLPPAGIATAYASILLAMSREMDAAIMRVLADAGAVRADSIRMDAPADGAAPPWNGEGIEGILRAITAALRRIASRSALLSGIMKIADRTNTYSRQQWQEQLKRTIGIDLSKDADVAPLLARFRKRQGDLITSLSRDKVARVRRVLVDAGSDARVETITRRIREQTGATESRATLIARTEVTSFNAQLSSERHQAAGITEFVWSTSRDERVRETHRELDGKLFRYDNPPEIEGEGKHLPGAFPNCRCVGIAVIPGLDD